jgi:hypothetical protein
MSFDAYRIGLMKRALGRSDAELFGHRGLYEAALWRAAVRLIAGEPDST